MPDHILIMGVCGTGKTTIGQKLAEAIGGAFEDADAYHPDANVAKMKAGIPLNDSDRADWLEQLNQMLCERAKRGESVILACSALKEKYRAVLNRGLDAMSVVHLQGSRDLLAKRLQQRREHFMPVSLLDSQLADLEIPQNALSIDVAMAPEQIVHEIIHYFKPNN